MTSKKTKNIGKFLLFYRTIRLVLFAGSERLLSGVVWVRGSPEVEGDMSFGGRLMIGVVLIYDIKKATFWVVIGQLSCCWLAALMKASTTSGSNRVPQC